MHTVPLHSSLWPFFSLFLANALSVDARVLHSLPEDPFAFPKYRVTFLNDLPLQNETAERWIKDGLRGGELEFLDQPWHEVHWDGSRPLKEIGSGQTGAESQTAASHTSSHSLEFMKLGPRDSYLCLIPPSTEQNSPAPEDSHTEWTPAQGWSLLQPLTGSCIYHRQGWFTYAYCHNSHVRQFREMIPSHPIAPGSYEIEEDPDSEAFDLGRAPSAPEPGADLSVAEQAAANLELARSAGSRYLVQRWGDGTVCDKTGRHREIEVQFHCSMTTTDSILFVKETKTCHYVLVVNTPRLCGEPGFKSRIDQREEALVRCREVVDVLPAERVAIPEADHPIKLPPRGPKRVPPPPPIDGGAAQPDGAPADDGDDDEDDDHMRGEDLDADADGPVDHTAVIRRTLERLLERDNILGGEGAPRVVVEELDDGEMVIEFFSEVELDEDALEGGGGGAEEEQAGPARARGAPDNKAIAEALRKAGYELFSDKGKTKPKARSSPPSQQQQQQQQQSKGKEKSRRGPPVARGRRQQQAHAQAGQGRDEL